ncbi:hypothetical protein PaeCFBP13512_08725 [Paenibacillus sp. CFBP13512]|uniref:ABC-three component system middle component 7 n=1 Tax=Paenibacillus sp. CFBP13512 TaxID=2184007 RepID=UPI00113D4CE5|nr:hypothetical protein PaeCFBP13512_08725 [Paenibacillus sp. CFBP13512]
MIIPNKVLKFQDTIMSKMLIVLSELIEHEQTISELYENTNDQLDSIEEFIYSIDTLYLLDAIEINWESRMVNYVKRN